MQSEQTTIGELAYRIWQARGCPEGTAEKDWLDAEKQLQSKPASEPHTTEPTASNAIDRSSQESFPASDPPASHLPDVPPANADDRWKAAAASRMGSAAARSRRPKSG
jgi:hypothetical protein